MRYADTGKKSILFTRWLIVVKSSGQSIFGSDLASDMGCITDLTKRDDIRVGFGIGGILTRQSLGGQKP